MSYHLRLCKALSYTGLVEATKKEPDVYVDDKATADAAIATGYFKLVDVEDAEPQTPETAHIEKAQLEDMKIDDLKKLATDMNIDTTGFKRKADYVEAIAAVEVTLGEEVETEADYGDAE